MTEILGTLLADDLKTRPYTARWYRMAEQSLSSKFKGQERCQKEGEFKKANKSVHLVTSHIHKCLEGISMDPDFEEVENIVDDACDSQKSEVDHRAQRQFPIMLFCCKKVEKTSIDTDAPYVKELTEKGKDSQRTINYCQTIKQCSHLFRMFELALGASLFHRGKNRNRLVDMMHSGTPSSVKDNVLDQFADQTKCPQVLIATTVYGMAVNCKGVTQMIHFGPSKSIKAYMQ
ncbi:hypothetical protein ACROYT_G014420 [Oculina patagonica]